MKESARGGIRTRNPVRAEVFKTAVYTGSTTRAITHAL